MHQWTKKRTRRKTFRCRASVGPLDDLLLETTSPSRETTSSSSKPCRALLSESSSILMPSSSVAFLSKQPLVAPSFASVPSTVCRADFNSFFALASSIVALSRPAFVVSSSSLEPFNSFSNSSRFLVSALVSSPAWALVSAFAVFTRRSTCASVKVFWGEGCGGAWLKKVVIGPKAK